MQIKPAPESDELRIRVDGGCIPFAFGGALLALGLFLLAVTWRGEALRPIPASLIGAALTGAGALVAFFCSGFVVDRRHRLLISWSSFLGFKKTRQYGLERFVTLKLVPYRNRSRHGPRRVFRILLCFSDHQTNPLELGTQLAERQARDHAACIAEFTGLPTTEESDAEQW